MKILFIGYADPRYLARFRADALVRLGHQVTIADPYQAFPREMHHPVLGRFHKCSGYRFLQDAVCAWMQGLVRKQRASQPEVIWVDHGELFGFEAASMLRRFECPILLHNLDDPTGSRDGRRFDSLQRALPAYDLCAVVRTPNVAEFLSRGARSVYRTWRSYDEVVHRPFEHASQIAGRFHSEVAFLGTWIRGEGREVFIAELLKRGVPVAIWGDRWNRSPGWRSLKRCWRGSALHGREYVAAIQAAKVALGFVSHGNRDLHTARSMEIPYAGGLLCAERTSEHVAIYRDGVEAALWEDAAQCAEACFWLLADEAARDRIRSAGRLRVIGNGFSNEVICGDLLNVLLKNGPGLFSGEPVAD